MSIADECIVCRLVENLVIFLLILVGLSDLWGLRLQPVRFMEIMVKAKIHYTSFPVASS